MPLRSRMRSVVRLVGRHWSFRPALALTVVAMLAIGSGAAIGMFSVVDAVVLRSLPWPDAERLAFVHATVEEERGNPGKATSWNRAPITWEAWEQLQHSPAIEEIGVWMEAQQILDVTLSDGDVHSEAVEVAHTSTAYLSLLGARTVSGRLFNAAEDSDVATDAVVLSHSAWLSLFGGADDIVGKQVTIRPALQFAGSRKTVVGVLSPGFLFPSSSPTVLLPIGLQSWNARYSEDGFLRALVRLAPGVTPADATQMVEAIVRGSEPRERRLARVVGIRDELVGPVVPSFLLLFGGSAIVLAISLAVAGGLLLNDVISRQREMAIRLALGASRRRVVTQVLIEHLSLGIVGALAGLVIAQFVGAGLARASDIATSGVTEVAVDIRAVVVSIFIVATGLAGLGLAAGRSAVRAVSSWVGGPNAASASATRRKGAGERLAFAAVLALTLALTAGAGLFADTVIRLRASPIGFDPTQLAVIGVKPARTGSTPPAAASEVIDLGSGLPTVRSPLAQRPPTALRQRSAITSWLHTEALLHYLASLPHVESVAGVMAVPFGGGWREAPVQVVGDPTGSVHLVQAQAITPSYFETLDIPILDGRPLSRADRNTGRVVVSEEFRNRLLTGDGLGAEFMRSGRRYTVVGVAGDVAHNGFKHEKLQTYYVLDSTVAHTNHVVVRTAGDATEALPSIRSAIKAHNPYLLITSSDTMRGMMTRALAEEEIRSRASMAFCAIAVLLTSIGFVSLLSRQVAERYREIAIRLALGARPRDLYRLVLGQVGFSVALGLVGGLLGSVLVVRLVSAVVGNVTASTPAVLLVSVTAMLFVAALAAIIPARRASQIDPVLALHD